MTLEVYLGLLESRLEEEMTQNGKLPGPWDLDV